MLAWLGDPNHELVQDRVDLAGAVSGYTSLALDESGKMHISYDDSTNGGDLKYATNAIDYEAESIKSGGVGMWLWQYQERTIALLKALR